MSGVDVIGVASGIFTLLSVTTALLDILEDISKCGARCDEFQKDLESLQGVLQHVESEYRKNIDLIEKIDESSCSKADSELTASLGRLFSTCRDLETIFKPINAKKWNINKKLAWDRSEKNLTILHRRLESQKSNLELTLRAITYVP
jgi:predicted nuclease with TOPRIM domain